MASRSDELVSRILAALERLPEDRARRLVDEAWQEAEASVREVLVTAMRAALLRRTAAVLEGGAARPQPRPRDPEPEAPEPPEPQSSPAPAATTPQPRAESDTAVYVYGIVPAGDLTVPEDLHGVDPEAPVEVVSRNGLDALFSQVRTDEFGPDALRERLADRAWLEDKVRRHEEVVRVGLRARALVPMRFCTVVRSAEALAGFLDEHAERLHAGLADLTDRQELGVKVVTVPERFDEHVRATSGEVRALDEQAGSGGAGAAYFLTKRRRQLVEDEGERLAAAFAAATHERLAAEAARAVALDPRREEDDAGGHLVLNGAYLVDDERHERFLAVVEEVTGEGAGRGLAVRLTGPWPPYSFVDTGMAAEVAR